MSAAEPGLPPQTDRTESGQLRRTAVEAADLAERYDAMMHLAALFDSSGEELRRRSRLGAEIVRDPSFTESLPAARATGAAAEEAVVAATTGKRGLLTRSIELDADALVLRATVLTYRWIDELQDAAYHTLGAIAGRAIGYLAPQVALGGAIVSAGLIETDAIDRDGVASYLDELAEANPELMEHVTSGGGGLLDGLAMRSLLTAGVLAGEDGRLAAVGGLHAIGVEPMPTGFDAALRDVAGGLVDVEPEPAAATSPAGEGSDADAPRSLTDLMQRLDAATSSVAVHRVAPGRYLAYLPGPAASSAPQLRLVGGDASAHAGHVLRSLAAATAGDPDARVMLVGSAQGGVIAAEVAALAGRPVPVGSGARGFTVDQVVTTGAPSAHVPRIAEPTRVLSLEDRTDPVALLGSLVNADVANRLTVVFDVATGLDGDSPGVAGARAADAATHPGLRAEITRLHRLGYLAG